MKDEMKDEGDWIERLAFPLTSMLADIEELEVLIFGLERTDYIQDDILAAQVWDLLINIAFHVRAIMEFQPEVLETHESFEWRKLIKLGEQLDGGKAILCWSIAWRMATRDMKEIKVIILGILGLNCHDGDLSELAT